MKKRKWIIGIGYFFAVIVVGMTISQYNRYPSITSGLNEFHQHKEVIHIVGEVPLSEATMVFYQIGDPDYLLTALLEKRFTGWHYIYGGVESVADLPQRLGITATIYPKIEGNDAYVIFGKIVDERVDHVEIDYSKDKETLFAEIYETDVKDLWVVELKDIEERDLIINAYSEDKLLYQLQEKIPESYE